MTGPAVQATRRNTVVVDFDGVLAEYDGWKGPDVFGEPMEGAADALRRFRESGWLIVIWTTRQLNQALIAWLVKHPIAWDTINSAMHNPPGTSEKPIATVYIDDRGWYTVGRAFEWAEVMGRLGPLYGLAE